VGIVSFGVGCGEENYAGVNARVSGAIDWIQDQVCSLSSYPPEHLCGDDTTPNPTMPSGLGAMTVQILYDDYPGEVAWRITHQDSNTQFYFQPFEEATEQMTLVEHYFDRLPPGRYILEFGDDAGTYRSMDSALDSTKKKHGYVSFLILHVLTYPLQVTGFVAATAAVVYP
jgi:nitrate reductase NapE component